MHKLLLLVGLLIALASLRRAEYIGDENQSLTQPEGKPTAEMLNIMPPLLKKLWNLLVSPQK